MLFAWSMNASNWDPGVLVVLDLRLAEAYSPGGPGAILIFQASRERVDSAVASLPLALAGLIDTEIIELHPFAGLAS